MRCGKIRADMREEGSVREGEEVSEGSRVSVCEKMGTEVIQREEERQKHIE